jgi:serine/threonine-protein kinase
MSWLRSSLERARIWSRKQLGIRRGESAVGLLGELGPHSGEIIDGHALGASVGSGGVGQVYRARRVSDGALRAVKILYRPAQLDEAARRRFVREVDALRRLRSPHVVEVLEWGLTHDGYLFLVMDLLEGESLQTLLERQGRLPLDEVVRCIDHVAAGLEPARPLGIVHRDLKPSNLFVAGRCWKILDFGSSKIYGVQTSITWGGAIGTPYYMSPEQAQGEPLDHRSDVFALATVAYAALTGVVPFAAGDPLSALHLVIGAQPKAPSSLVDVHPDVDLALALGMAKSVHVRAASASELAAALRQGASGALPEELRLRARRILELHPWEGPPSAPTGPPPPTPQLCSTVT